jgi:hypothetical protein
MAQKINPVMIAAIGGGGYLAWKWWKDKQAAEQAAAVSSQPILPPNTRLLPDGTQVLVPPVSTQTYTPAVQTPYGAVIPSNFSTGTSSNAPVSDPTTQARMIDIIYRNKYIVNSIAYGLQWSQTPAGQADAAGLATRIATLRSKAAVLQEEYGRYTGGKLIPLLDTSNATNKANYIAFLQQHSWCDPLVGVPC